MLVRSMASPTTHRTPVAIKPFLAPENCKDQYYISVPIPSKLRISIMLNQTSHFLEINSSFFASNFFLLWANNPFSDKLRSGLTM